MDAADDAADVRLAARAPVANPTAGTAAPTVSPMTTALRFTDFTTVSCLRGSFEQRGPRTTAVP